MLARDSLRVETLKMLKSAVQNATIAQSGELDESAVLKLIQKESQQRAEAATQYSAAGKSDMAEKELAEKSILDEYLPEQLTESELEQIITNAITSINATSLQDMGRVMAIVSSEVAGRADSSVVATSVKKHLSN